MRQPSWIKPLSSSLPNLRAVASSILEKFLCWLAIQSISSLVITPVETDSRKSSPRFMVFFDKGLVKEGFSGYTCDIGDTEEMFKKSLLLLDENKSIEFKKNSYELAKKFDIENILPLYINFYNSIINK